MWQRFRSYLGLAAAYTRFNFKAHMEYRGAFISEIVAMLINDVFWIAFWVLFFSNFPVLRGWTLEDVVTLWAISAAGFGLAFGFMGNASHLAGIVAAGQIDVWLMYPRAVLSHLLLGRMSATAWGDVLFGLGAYIFAVRPQPAEIVLFAALAVSVAGVFVGFSVLTASLSFFIGHAGPLADQFRFALVTFSTYPPMLFQGFAKVILFTLIPSAFVSYIPVEALRGFSLLHAAAALAGSAAVAYAVARCFYWGLRRYESGNLVMMRE